uniref:Proopiomelanocortin n=1 Tax=Callorhinchus milii TaxID=7868 RepID=A0A4W3J0Y0_CALMI
MVCVMGCVMVCVMGCVMGCVMVCVMGCVMVSVMGCVMGCVMVCVMGLEVPLFPGNGRLMPVAEALRSYLLGPREDKRSYSMEHFRWGKPVGRKRRPIKVYPNEDTSAEGLGDELKRQISAEAWGPGEAWGLGREIWGLGDKAWGPVQAQGPWGPGEETWGPEKETWGPGQETWVPGQEPEQKKDGKLYKMTHFRWGSPLKDKRYGGFMNSWDRRPLLTLFRNVMGKEAQQKSLHN